MLSKQREDLDKAILRFTESILLLPRSRLQHSPIILHVLFSLASALLLRSAVSKQPEDAICATICLSHLRDQPHEIPSIPRYKVTALLVGALALQVELEAGNSMQNIREMAVLSRKLLETSDLAATHFILLIHAVVKSKIRSGVPDQPLDELIEFSRVARKRRPDLLEGRMTLAASLVWRYHMTCANDDYEEASSILDEIIADSSPGNSQDESGTLARAQATGLVTVLAMMRSSAYQTPEFLEEAIYRTRTFVSSPSVKEHLTGMVLDPEATSNVRFTYFGSIEGVEASSSKWLSLETPEDLAWKLEYNQTFEKMKNLRFRIRNNDDTMEVDEAIAKGRSILASLASPHEPILDLFGGLLREAFHRTKKTEYLNESINISRQLIESPFPRAEHSLTILPKLFWSLMDRFTHFPGYRTQDLDEALELLSQYVSSAHVSVLDRFWFACTWARFARLNRHSSVSTAYETALSLMQDTVPFSPTLL